MSTLDLQNNLIKNARALVYRNKGGQRLFLLTQELDGHFTIPGGCKDMGDEDLLSAMKREMKEEFNLGLEDCEIRDTGIQKTYQKLYRDPTSKRFEKDTLIQLFLVRCNNKWSMKTSNEIKSVQWFEYDNALQSLTTDHMREMFLLGTKLLN